MIAPAVAAEIKRLLDQGEASQRKIARQTGASRGTVNAIALGKRPDYGASRRKRGGGFVVPGGPLVRCPGCGGMVQMPCLACRVRAMKEVRRLCLRREANRYGCR